MRDPEASEPFTQDQLAIVFGTADGDVSGWAGKAVRFLAYTGAHISVLSGGFEQCLVREGESARYEDIYHPPIRSDAIRGGSIYWRRPKNRKQIGMPLSRNLADWVGPWLDEPRPASRRRYGQVLERIGRACHLQVNPLRFRHTCAVLLFHIYGMKAQEIERLLGVTPQTLTTYVLKPAYMVAEELRQKGW